MGTLHLVGFAEIGSYLREVRQSLGVDAAQAARALHLRPKFLEALEAGNLEDLPGLTYARGYLSSYADYLQLDKVVLLKAFDEATKFRPSVPYSPEPTRREARPGWILIGLSLLVLIGIMFAWQKVIAPSADRMLESAPEKPMLSVAAPAKLGGLGSVVPQARACLSAMPVEGASPFCYWQPLPRWLGMTPKMRYSSELVFPTYLILYDVR